MFSQQKTELTNLLSNIACKVSFPQKLLQNLNRCCLQEMSNQMDLYNKNISKAKLLLEELSLISEWGIFWNSYKMWNFSTRKILLNDEFYKKKIFELSLINNSCKDFNVMIKNKILSQSKVNSTLIWNFMHVHKCLDNPSQSYQVEQFDTTLGIFVKSPISYNNILYLLPNCMIMETGKSIFDCYNPVKTLDEFDLVVKIYEFDDIEYKPVNDFKDIEK